MRPRRGVVLLVLCTAWPVTLPAPHVASAALRGISSAAPRRPVGASRDFLHCVSVTLRAQSGASATYVWELPRGFPTPAVPADNPMSAAKVALGRRLFFESRLSVTGRQSCAGCHDPARSFSDGKPLAVGALGDVLPRNAMALVNVAYNVSFGWIEPNLRSLETQMRQPLLNTHPVELGLAGREEAMTAGLAADPTYAAAFADAFPDDSTPATFDHVVKAIAAFERTLISGNSAFDRYVFQGDHTALTEPAKRGMALFFSRTVGLLGLSLGLQLHGHLARQPGGHRAACLREQRHDRAAHAGTDVAQHRAYRALHARRALSHTRSRAGSLFQSRRPGDPLRRALTSRGT